VVRTLGLQGSAPAKAGGGAARRLSGNEGFPLVLTTIKEAVSYQQSAISYQQSAISGEVQSKLKADR
jgi:hypothetical protein